MNDEADEAQDRAAPPRTARRRAREIALQMIYAWQLSGAELADLLDQARTLVGYDKANEALLEAVVRGVYARAEELEACVAPCLDRTFAELSPVERSILYIGAFELLAMPETPFKVIINEAIDLGKGFGGTDGHKFVNGVLEKLAATLRPDETRRGGRRRGAAQAQP